MIGKCLSVVIECPHIPWARNVNCIYRQWLVQTTFSNVIYVSTHILD